MNFTLGAILPVTLPDGSPLLGQSPAFGYFAPGSQFVCAFLMAAQQVSRSDPAIVPTMASLVPNTTVHPMLFDSRSSPVYGIAGYRAARSAGAHALLTGRSLVTGYIGTLSALDRLPVCSFWGTDPSFSNKASFPYLARSVPSTAQAAAVIPGLIRSFGWKAFSIIALNDPYSSSFAYLLRQNAAASGLSVVVTSSYEELSPTSYAAACRTLREATTNIIMHIGLPFSAPGLFVAAEEAGLLAPQHVWINTDFVTPGHVLFLSPDKPRTLRHLAGMLHFFSSPPLTTGWSRFVVSRAGSEPACLTPRAREHRQAAAPLCSLVELTPVPIPVPIPLVTASLHLRRRR